MKAKEIQAGKQRSFVLVFATGEEALKTLLAFADEHDLRGAHFTAIGAFSRATIAYWRWETKAYEPIEIAEQVEVLSLSGNVTWAREKRRVHAHVVMGKADGTAHGGHLQEGFVRPTLEMIVTEWAEELRRELNPETGLPLLDPGAPRP